MKAGLWKGNKKKFPKLTLRSQISHRFHYIIKNNSCPQIESIVFLSFEFPSISSHIDTGRVLTIKVNYADSFWGLSHKMLTNIDLLSTDYDFNLQILKWGLEKFLSS